LVDGLGERLRADPRRHFSLPLLLFFEGFAGRGRQFLHVPREPLSVARCEGMQEAVELVRSLAGGLAQAPHRGDGFINREHLGLLSLREPLAQLLFRRGGFGDVLGFRAYLFGRQPSRGRLLRQGCGPCVILFKRPFGRLLPYQFFELLLRTDAFARHRTTVDDFILLGRARQAEGVRGVRSERLVNAAPAFDDAEHAL
jgi:hypothetical protein